MRFSFDSCPIVVTAEISGPTGKTEARMILDTGAAMSVVNPRVLASVGIDLTAAARQASITTANGVISVALVQAKSLSSLGIERSDPFIVAHPLPKNATVDGLLGTDFLDDLIIVMNFHKKWVEVRTGNRSEG